MSDKNIEEVLREYEDKQKQFEDRLNKIEKDNVEHGAKLNAFEKEMIAMTKQLDTIGNTLEKMHDKIDAHGTYINDLRVEFPKFMTEFIDKNAKRTEEIVGNHEIQCTSKLDSRFLALPEGWKGNVVKVLVVLFAGLFGLDLGGVVNISNREDKKEIVQAERPIQGMVLQDRHGNLYMIRDTTISIASHTDNLVGGTPR